MGKFRQHAGRRNNAKSDTGVDQHGLGDGSRGTEQGAYVTLQQTIGAGYPNACQWARSGSRAG